MTIRFYEESGLIQPASRLENRYHAYDDKDVQKLRFIHRARALGFSVKEIGELLELYRNGRRASSEIKCLALAHVKQLDLLIAELTGLRNTIAELARRRHGDSRPECPILEELGREESVVPGAGTPPSGAR